MSSQLIPGKTGMANVDAEYRRRMDSLAGRERVVRSIAMLEWTREMLARRILTELGPISDERLRWEVALRMYGADAGIRRMIERRLADVSG